jgi:AICAR transformylase/IMP cyclohydrolase PurH
MEPINSLPINLKEDDTDIYERNDDMTEINVETLKNIDLLKVNIIDFKKQLFNNSVSNDKIHKASDIGSMMLFHALFLQSIAYWISLLDDKSVSEPQFEAGRDKLRFQKISKLIKDISKMNSDARTLVYSALFTFSTQHPYDMGTRPKMDTHE